MQNYDTREIRAAARNVNELADRLESLKRGAIPKARDYVQDARGDTVRAIQEQLDALEEEIRALYRSLGNAADALFAFARRLDIADEKAQALITSR